MLHLILLSACAVEPAAPPAAAPAPNPAPASPSKPAPADGDDEPREFSGTVGVVEKPFAGKGTTMLNEVRATSRKGFDRAAFVFAGGLPGYHLEYVDKPTVQCGSGEPLPVAGDAWLEVRFDNAVAHTEEGQPTIPFSEQPLSLGVMRELQRTCDFEGVVSWVIGVKSPNAYRVIEKGDRLLVDIEH